MMVAFGKSAQSGRSPGYTGEAGGGWGLPSQNCGRVRLPLRRGLAGPGGGSEQLLEVNAFDADASSDADGAQGAADAKPGPM